MPLNRLIYFPLILLILTIAFIGCASIQQPTGGPRDTLAPKVLKETPANQTRNFKAREINITISEFFKLQNEFKEISISPAMEKLPTFKAKKNILNIKFDDTLQKNTTYTFNFGNAIVDFNEGNKLKNYSYVFSTGPVIDSLNISGVVKDRLKNAPVLDATVFIIPINQDTIFGKKRANIFTTTDSSGQYILKNLRPDTYRIYALKEESGDRIYNSPKELIAFQKDSIVLSRDNALAVNLELFQEEPDVLRMVDKKIEKDGKILITYNKGIAKPSAEIIDPQELNTGKIVEFSSKRDSLMLWLPEMKFDSLKIAVKENGESIDTVKLTQGKKETYNRNLSISTNLVNNRLRPKTDLYLTFTGPSSTLDGAKIKVLEDSVPKRAQLIKDTTSTRRYLLRYPWRLNHKYELEVAEGGFTNTVGGKNKPFRENFTLDEDENYGNIVLDISTADSIKTSKAYVIELLNKERVIIKSQPLLKAGKITFSLLPVGAYNIRVTYDTNKNGKWDTGKVGQKIQPERTWTFDKELTIRANWDLEEKITIPDFGD